MLPSRVFLIRSSVDSITKWEIPRHLKPVNPKEEACPVVVVDQATMKVSHFLSVTTTVILTSEMLSICSSKTLQNAMKDKEKCQLTDIIRYFSNSASSF